MIDLTSRKFLLTCAVVLLSYALVFSGKLQAKEWLDMAVIAAGIYSAANVANDVLKK